ncbi:MAG: sulfurtransferase TusA family protein [Proteobacteria bacterium]|nr:sulfurtransferase TusA family protein [Pseudomonadota bacterium]
MSEDVLDVTGLICPLPVLKAKKALKGLAPGATLAVLATDPASVKDFKAFCETTGNRLESCSEEDGVYRFRIRKGG